ncbi:MAG: GA module-containing protein [Corynebacterium sp.]|nr:GA module-containing protein [Corynebacterium sp.]
MKHSRTPAHRPAGFWSFGKFATLSLTSVSTVVALSTIGPMVAVPGMAPQAFAETINSNHSTTAEIVPEVDSDGYLTGTVQIIYTYTNTASANGYGAYFRSPALFTRNLSVSSGRVTVQNAYLGINAAYSMDINTDKVPSWYYYSHPLTEKTPGAQSRYAYQIIAPGGTLTVKLSGARVSANTMLYVAQALTNSTPSMMPTYARDSQSIMANYEKIVAAMKAEGMSEEGLSWILGTSANDAVGINEAVLATADGMTSANDESSLQIWAKTRQILLDDATIIINNTSFSAARKQEYIDEASAATDTVGITDVANIAKSRDAGLKTIAALPGLQDSQKQDFSTRVEAATTRADVDSIIDEAYELSGVSIEDQREAAFGTLNNLADLTEAEMATFTDAINAATTRSAINQVLHQAAEANNANLTVKRNTAVERVSALGNIDSVEMLNYFRAIADAETGAEALAIANEAVALDKRRVDEARAAATTTINGLNLSQDRKDYYLGLIKPAKLLRPIQQAVADATDEASQTVDGARAVALRALALMVNLNTADTNEYKQKIQEASTVPAINALAREARLRDAQRLNSEITSALETLKTLKSKLGTTRYNHYQDLINSAATRSFVGDTLAQARMEAAGKLDQARGYASSRIQSLENLSKAARDKASVEVLNLGSISAVFEYLDKRIAEDSQALEARRTEVRTAILADENLTEIERDNYLTLANAATSVSALDSVLGDATSQSSSNLNRARVQAIADIANTTNLYKEDIASFKAQVGSAQNLAKVAEIVAAAQAKAEANLEAEKTRVRKAIADLSNLTEANRTRFTTEVDDLKVVDNGQGIIDAATAQDRKDLDAYRDSAIERIQQLTHIDTAPYVADAQAATTIAAIQTIEKNASDADAKQASLNEARAKAEAEINKLPNVSLSDYTARLDAAQSVEEIERIADAAVKDNATLRDQARMDANNIVQALSDLTDAERDDYHARIAGAQKVDIIKQISAEAVATNLGHVKTRVSAALDKLDALSVDAKSGFSQRITKAGTTDEVAQIQAEAEAANKTALEALRTATLEELARVAEFEGKQGYVDAVKTTTSAKEILSQGLAAAKIGSTAEINALPNIKEADRNRALTIVSGATVIADVLQAVINAKADDYTNLYATKQEAQAELKTLENLSTEAQAGYAQRVKDAATIAAVKSIMEEAHLANSTNFETFRSEALTKLNGLVDLADKTPFADRIAAANNRADVNAAVADAEAANLAVVVAEREAATKSVNDLVNLSEKQSYLAEIAGATTVAAIKEVLTQATKAAQEELDAHRSEALKTIDDLPNDADLASIRAKVETATTKTEIDDLVSEARTADAQAYDDAKAKAITDINALVNLGDASADYLQELETAPTAGELAAIVQRATNADKAALESKRTAVTTTINDYPVLPTRADFLDEVTDATSIAELDKILERAKNAADLAIAQLRDNARTQVKALANLTATDKSGYYTEITAANDEATLNDIVARATAEDALGLQAAKERAQAIVDELENLIDTDKDSYRLQIDNATTASAIEDVLIAARAADAAGLAYARARAAQVLTSINGLDDEDREKFQSGAASSVAIADIDRIIQEAKDQAAAYIAEQRDLYSGQVQALANLDDATKQSYITKINSTNSTGMMSVYALNAMTADQALVREAREAAKPEVQAVANLTPIQTQNFLDMIDNEATTVAEVKLVVDTAKKQAAINMQKARDNARETITGLLNLSEIEKQEPLATLDELTTLAEILSGTQRAVALDAQYLANARQTAVSSVDALKNLDAATKKQYISNINRAASISTVSDLVAEAANMDVLAFQTYKEQAIDSIKGLSNLGDTSQTSYAQRINDALDRNTVDTIVAMAKAENNTSLEDTKTSVVSYVDGLNSLPDSVKQQYVQRISNAATAAEAKAIMAAAEQQNKEILQNSQNNGASLISGFSNLSLGEREELLQKVKSAQSKEEVDSLLEDVQQYSSERPSNNQNSSNDQDQTTGTTNNKMPLFAILGLGAGILAIIAIIVTALGGQH